MPLLPNPRKLLRHALMSGGKTLIPNPAAPVGTYRHLRQSGRGRLVSGAGALAGGVLDNTIAPGTLGSEFVRKMLTRRGQQFDQTGIDQYGNTAGIPTPQMGFAQDDWLEQMLADRDAGMHDAGGAPLMVRPTSTPEARRRPMRAASFVRSAGVPAPSDRMIRHVARQPGGNPRILAHLQRRIDAMNRDALKFDDDDDLLASIGVRNVLGRSVGGAGGQARDRGLPAKRPTYPGGLAQGGMPTQSGPTNLPANPLSPSGRGARNVRGGQGQNYPSAAGAASGGGLADLLNDTRRGRVMRRLASRARPATSATSPDLDFNPEPLDFKPMQRPAPQGRTYDQMIAERVARITQAPPRLAPTPPRHIPGANLAGRRPAMKRLLGLRGIAAFDPNRSALMQRLLSRGGVATRRPGSPVAGRGRRFEDERQETAA